MTAAEAQNYNVTAVVESDGQVVEGGKVTYTYKKKKMCIRDRYNIIRKIVKAIWQKGERKTCSCCFAPAGVQYPTKNKTQGSS